MNRRWRLDARRARMEASPRTCMQLRLIIVATEALSADVWCVLLLALSLIIWSFGCASIHMRILPMSAAGCSTISTISVGAFPERCTRNGTRSDNFRNKAVEPRANFRRVRRASKTSKLCAKNSDYCTFPTPQNGHFLTICFIESAQTV